MDNRLRTATLSLAAFAFLALGAAAPAPAQVMNDSPRWTVDASGGIGIPVGDVADLPIDDVGPAFNLGVGYFVSPRFAVTVDGGAEIYPGEFDVAPDVRFFHYNAGLEAQVTEPGASALDVTVNVAAGGTTWDTDGLTPPGGGANEFSSNYFTVNGGVHVGYAFADNVVAFADGQWYQQFTDEEETAQLADVSPDLQEGFSSASSVPLTVGLRFRL